MKATSNVLSVPYTLAFILAFTYVLSLFVLVTYAEHFAMLLVHLLPHLSLPMYLGCWRAYVVCLSFPVQRHGIALSTPFTALR